MKATRKFMTRTVVAVIAAGMTAVAAPTAANAISPTLTTAATVSSSSHLSAEVARTVKGTGFAAVQQALAAYWTPSRMKAALPDSALPALQAGAAMARTSLRTGAATTVPGAAEKIAAYAPTVTPRASVPGVLPRASLPGYPVGHPTARTNGKVFFTSFGQNFVCSGAIVNTEGKSEVWTAGHCVSDGGAFNTNWVFVPNYVNGSAPFGVWSSASLTTTTAWFNNNGDFANDVGAAVVFRNNGVRITDFLGGQGIAWNQVVSGNLVFAFGYPQAPPFDGSSLFLEQGVTSDGGGGTIFQANAMTGGSSGGPWLLGFDGNFGFINGHNDFKFNNLPQFMYSPYYGDQVAAVYNAVRNITT